MTIDLRPITAPTGQEFEKLLNDPRVTKHMPLHTQYMSATDCEAWAHAKAEQWGEARELGPWSVYIDDQFVGWGGLQPENDGEAGIALVLLPEFWGYGLEIMGQMIRLFLANGGSNRIVVQLATSRSATRAMERLGLVADGQVIEAGKVFDRFVLSDVNQLLR